MSDVRGETDPGRSDHWSALASSAPFYCGADWLRFADSDGLATSHYLTLDGEAALSAHHTPAEVNGGYLPGRQLSGAGEELALTLGGRRGYLSAPLLAGDDPAPLTELVRAAVKTPPLTRGRWWWPYLTGPDAALVLRATGPWRPRAHLLGADCVLPVPEGGLDGYLAALPAKQRRTNVRRELRRYRDSGLRTVSGRLSEWAEVCGPMLSRTQRKYGHDHSPELMTDLLRRQARYLDDRSVVFVSLDEDDHPVGFCLAYAHGPTLWVRVVGFDYARLRDADEYAELAVHSPLRHCQRWGMTQLHLGTGSYQAKCRRGARLRPLWAVSALGEPESTPALEVDAPGREQALLAEAIETDRRLLEGTREW
ncbi:GNAT family N-acetyltransferase [Streptomyces sp. NPDC005438]|uniref:GNAT family N-acetyltransferase n=1 Tax=Streptomyces sp. NPDC005438 TaxID=3156880 RepID=UPI0033B36B78